ncbi:unnamed protein product [Musa acuminata var. zebrina]
MRMGIQYHLRKTKEKTSFIIKKKVRVDHRLSTKHLHVFFLLPLLLCNDPSSIYIPSTCITILPTHIWRKLFLVCNPVSSTAGRSRTPPARSPHKCPILIRERERELTPQPYRRKTPTGGNKMAKMTSKNVSDPISLSLKPVELHDGLLTSDSEPEGVEEGEEASET